jgi:hypothetical protein
MPVPLGELYPNLSEDKLRVIAVIAGKRKIGSVDLMRELSPYHIDDEIRAALSHLIARGIIEEISGETVYKLQMTFLLQAGGTNNILEQIDLQLGLLKTEVQRADAKLDIQ